MVRATSHLQFLLTHSQWVESRAMAKAGVIRHSGDGHKAWAKTSVSPGVYKINWLNKFRGNRQ